MASGVHRRAVAILLAVGGAVAVLDQVFGLSKTWWVVLLLAGCCLAGADARSSSVSASRRGRPHRDFVAVALIAVAFGVVLFASVDPFASHAETFGEERAIAIAQARSERLAVRQVVERDVRPGGHEVVVVLRRPGSSSISPKGQRVYNSFHDILRIYERGKSVPLISLEGEDWDAYWIVPQADLDRDGSAETILVPISLLGASPVVVTWDDATARYRFWPMLDAGAKVVPKKILQKFVREPISPYRASGSDDTSYGVGTFGDETVSTPGYGFWEVAPGDHALLLLDAIPATVNAQANGNGTYELHAFNVVFSGSASPTAIQIDDPRCPLLFEQSRPYPPVPRPMTWPMGSAVAAFKRLVPTMTCGDDVATHRLNVALQRLLDAGG